MPTPKKLFVSYAHQDDDLRQQLEEHLAPLRREGHLETWTDGKIMPGDAWEASIRTALEQAGTILLLVSPSFLASDSCYDVEMRRALERHAAGSARVVPIIVRACDWESAPFGKLQALPRGGKPVLAWESCDLAWLDVAKQIRGLLEGEPKPTFQGIGAEALRQLSADLDAALGRREQAICDGLDPAAINAEIREIRNRLREGAQLRPGDVLADRYKLLEEVGKGGFARVWRAYDRVRAQLVAVKVLHGQHAQDRTPRERFFRGARHMAGLHHSAVVGVVEECCMDDHYHFFVMEYLAGGDLRRAVLAGSVDQASGLRRVLAVGEALSFAHGQGLVHRDVTPANVMLTPDGAKLADFDLVRADDSAGGTRTQGIGKFLYAAPEVMKNARDADVPADVYGLAMTAVFVCHGEDLPGEVMWETAEFLEELAVSEAVREVLARGIAKKVAQRTASVKDFCDALRVALEPPPIVELPRTLGSWHLPDEETFGFLEVPGGTYRLGESLEHRAELSTFYMGRCPVTVTQFRAFVEASGCEIGDPDALSTGGDNHPVVLVSWHEAWAYCDWLDARLREEARSRLTAASDGAAERFWRGVAAGELRAGLPSEAEWEAAARGQDGRVYPWGDKEPTSEYANFQSDVGGTSEVGAYPRGAGPFGTLDQAGNVWEWCRDASAPGAYAGVDGNRDPADEASGRVWRGGSWAYRARRLRASCRDRFVAGNRYRYLGFRVVVGSRPEH